MKLPMAFQRRHQRILISILALASLLACGAPQADPSADPPADPPATTQAATPPEAEVVEERLPDGPFLEILGVAQDAGVPQAACTSANCEAARRDPRLRRYATSLVLVTTSGETYLFEATPDLRPQLDRVIELGHLRGRADQGRMLLDGILLTHAHMGHYTGLVHLGFEAAHSQNVPLFASVKMVNFLHDNQPWRQLIDLGNVVPYGVGLGAESRLDDDVVVRALAVPHRDELSDTVAWRIEGPNRTVLFMPDCDPWSRWPERGLPQRGTNETTSRRGTNGTYALEPMLEGVDTFVVDASFYSGDELPGRDLSKIGHPLVTDSLELLGDDVSGGELRVVFIHFNQSNPLLDPASAASEAVRAAGFELAHRGMQLPL